MAVNIVSWHKLPIDTCFKILGYTTQIHNVFSVVVVNPDEWDVIDSWFLKNYQAKRYGTLLEWQFPDQESYTEFLLKWT